MKRMYLFLTAIAALLLMITSVSFMRNMPSARSGMQADESAAEITAAVGPAGEEFYIPVVKDYRQYYGNILDNCLEIINGNEDAIDLVPGGIGIHEAAAWQEQDDALASIGYRIEDISGDEIPELIIGKISQDTPYGCSIFVIYTIKNEEPVATLEGWGRNAWYLMSDGRLLNSGSGGAAYSCVGIYDLSKDGTKTECRDFYFTNETDDTYAEIGVYHNTSGAWVVGVSEKLDISVENFQLEVEPYFNRIHSIPFTPFSEYPLADTGVITARLAEDALPADFIADNGTPQTTVLFCSSDCIEQFQVLSIEFVELNGTYEFIAKKLYDAGTLQAGQGFVMRMTFFGDLPSYAISYLDSQHVPRYFAIALSGKDGSLQLIEI